LSESIRRYMVSRVPVARADDTAGTTRDALAGEAFDSAAIVVVLKGDKPVGLVAVERLLAADDAAPLAAIMDRDPPMTTVDADREIVAATVARHRLPGIPVVDPGGRFQGVVPATRMLPVVVAEHDEDFARLGGYLASTKRARLAIEEPLGRRLWHRMPWLLIGLAGAMLSAVIVGAFEEQLQTKVLLAFFVPAVVYMAGAVGSQTVTVLVRALSIGVEPRTVFGREMLTGLVAGVMVGGAFFPFALLAWGDEQVALAVALALSATCVISTLVAMLLPWGLDRLGQDPAFGSGPVATIIQDLMSISVYLAIATPIAT
jgi:magnesium transporter